MRKVAAGGVCLPLAKEKQLGNLSRSQESQEAEVLLGAGQILQSCLLGLELEEHGLRSVDLALIAGFHLGFGVHGGDNELGFEGRQPCQLLGCSIYRGPILDGLAVATQGLHLLLQLALDEVLSCTILGFKTMGEQELAQLRGQEGTLVGCDRPGQAGSEGVLASALGIIVEVSEATGNEAAGESLIAAHAKWIEDHLEVLLSKMDGWDPGLSRRQLLDHIIEGLAIDPVAEPELGDVQLDSNHPRRGGPEGLEGEFGLVHLCGWAFLIERIFSF